MEREQGVTMSFKCLYQTQGTIAVPPPPVPRAVRSGAIATAPGQLWRQHNGSAVAVQSPGSGSSEELQLQQQHGGGNERSD
jgi:hypothetical protein